MTLLMLFFNLSSPNVFFQTQVQKNKPTCEKFLQAEFFPISYQVKHISETCHTKGAANAMNVKKKC